MSDIYGTSGDDTRQGSIGGDRIYGYEQGADPDFETGNDELHGGDGRDTIYGGGGNDILNGDNLNDTLYGQKGDDQLYGGSDNDYLDGGEGDDIFWIGGMTGVDTFLGGSGSDTVRLYENLTRGEIVLDVAAGVEVLDLAGFAMFGTNGSDTYDFSGLTSIVNSNGAIALAAGNDVFTGHAGVDVVDGGTFNDTLHGGEGNDRLTGGTGRDLIDGGAGDDIFFIGEIDTDTFVGGTGNDAIRLLNDTERQTLVLNAAAEVEVLDTRGFRLKGSIGNDTFDLSGLSELKIGRAPVDLQSGDDSYLGFAGKDNVNGGSGHDTIDAGGGADRIDGGGSADFLSGGAGGDSFVFSTRPLSRDDFDTIEDFDTRADRLLIDNRVFKGVGSDGSLARSAFVENLTGRAEDRNDRLIYESDTGRLFFDADGTGRGKSILIADLDRDLPLSASDFLII